LPALTKRPPENWRPFLFLPQPHRPSLAGEQARLLPKASHPSNVTDLVIAKTAQFIDADPALPKKLPKHDGTSVITQKRP
jgi:hypothetical protein